MIKYAVIQVRPAKGSYQTSVEVVHDEVDDIQYAERIRTAYLEISDDVNVQNIQVISYAIP